MIRYRKLWMILAVFVILFLLIGSFLKPDLVTVVPNRYQLNQNKSDLHIQSQSDKPVNKSDTKALPSKIDSTGDTLKIKN